MAVDLFAIFNIVCDEAKERKPEWVLNERIYNAIHTDCEAMEALLEQMGIVSVAVTIDENNGDCLMEYGCSDFILKNCLNHPIYSVFSHTTRFGFCKGNVTAEDNSEPDDALIMRLEYGGLFVAGRA